jgi:hypothetical protein
MTPSYVTLAGLLCFSNVDAALFFSFSFLALIEFSLFGAFFYLFVVTLASYFETNKVHYSRLCETFSSIYFV